MTDSDATPAYASWLNDREVNAYLSTKSATVSELKEYIATKNNSEHAELYGIFLKEKDIHIGTVKLEPIDRTHGWATIGILIGDKRQWGKGIAGEALRLLIKYCFQELHLDEVRLGVLAQNTNALRAYQKIGFKEISRTLGAVRYPNGICDQVEMKLQKHA